MSDSIFKENISLAPLTYYKIGGSARFYAQPENLDDLNSISAFLKKKQIPYFVLGAGSNVLLADEGFDGLIIHTSKLDKTLTQNGDEICVGASVLVIHLLRHCMTNGVAGFEFLVGVPGNMGGVMCMNAGTTLGEVDGAITEVSAFDLATGKERKISRSELKYSYRAQHFLNPHEIILRGIFKSKDSDPKTVQEHVNHLLGVRKKAQPIDKPSCGSVFKNPPKLAVWKVIADCGLRGHRIGNAQISEMHTNFIVNLGGAKASDVKALITEAKTRALAQFGVQLEEEVRIVDTGAQSGKML